MLSKCSPSPPSRAAWPLPWPCPPHAAADGARRAGASPPSRPPGPATVVSAGSADEGEARQLTLLTRGAAPPPRPCPWWPRWPPLPCASRGKRPQPGPRRGRARRPPRRAGRGCQRGLRWRRRRARGSGNGLPRRGYHHRRRSRSGDIRRRRRRRRIRPRTRPPGRRRRPRRTRALPVRSLARTLPPSRCQSRRRRLRRRLSRRRRRRPPRSGFAASAPSPRLRGSLATQSLSWRRSCCSCSSRRCRPSTSSRRPPAARPPPGPAADGHSPSSTFRRGPWSCAWSWRRCSRRRRIGARICRPRPS
mmetsp:Transcript_1361/g.4336  ORF Transcript_1361/g.4336 Transcript_1361/m.4336 type:complete len:305 (+) Transcript_1361:89-1003(+)